MKSPRDPENPSFDIRIEKLVYGGAGLGRHEGKVVFVPFSAAGDQLRVHPDKHKRNLIWASIEHVIEAGPARTAPFCGHFGVCGGCQWQQLEYAAQVEAKRSILTELFHHRFPETSGLQIGMKPSSEVRSYRSRARIQFRGHGSESVVGFFGFQSHGVVDIPECPLFRPALNAALAAVRELWKQGKADPGTRQAELVCSEEEGKWTWAEVEAGLEEGFFSLGKTGDAGPAGSPLARRFGGFEYRITPSAFFQANDFMTAGLIEMVSDLARDAGPGSALDLFSGVGLFSLPLAGRFKEVVAVESSSEASGLCQRAALNHGLANIRATCAEVVKWMNAIAAVTAPAFDLILLDPPRTGAGSEVMRRIGEWAPETVIYVSCDPQTLARDLAVLPARDYRIDYVQGLDLFPQTFHFETVVRLRRR